MASSVHQQNILDSAQGGGEIKGCLVVLLHSIGQIKGDQLLVYTVVQSLSDSLISSTRGTAPDVLSQGLVSFINSLPTIRNRLTLYTL